MSETRISTDDLSQSIKKLIDSYTDRVADGIQSTIKKITEKSASELQATSPKRTGDYARDWRGKVFEHGSYTYGEVYNQKHYQVTHLLEFGHANKSGGRTKAFEHVLPVNDEAVKEFETEIKRIIEGG